MLELDPDHEDGVHPRWRKRPFMRRVASTGAAIRKVLVASVLLVPKATFFYGAMASPSPDAAGPAGAVGCVSLPAVHIILARGAAEPPDSSTSALSPIAKAVVAALPGSDVEGVRYPAADGAASADAGVGNMTAQALAYAAACPSAKMVWMGYGQGALVVGDVMAGGGSAVPGGGNTKLTAPIDRTVMAKVAAVILFSDPTRQGGQAYDKLTCAKAAPNPRDASSAATFNTYAPIVQDYCDANDPNCCASAPSAEKDVSFSYFDKNNSANVATFVASRARGDVVGGA